MPSQYYEESLYPLQDGVLDILSRSGTDFFLTGGTALSRAHYNHRYSDDLDFFLSRSTTFDEQLDKVLMLLHENDFVVDCQAESNTAKVNAKCHKERKISDKVDAK
jgi:predicted nucleotidyltransferase component of viral defense system